MCMPFWVCNGHLGPLFVDRTVATFASSSRDLFDYFRGSSVIKSYLVEIEMRSFGEGVTLAKIYSS